MPRLNNPAYHLAKSVHEFRVLNLEGEPVKLDKYKNHICIIVNIATKSIFTDVHFKQFNYLMKKYGDSKGLRILAFPCDQFGHEEPCTSEQIAEHAKEYNVKFDVYAKVNVNCNHAAPLFKFLKKSIRIKGEKHGDVIKANYTKFIIDKQGIPIERHGPDMFPRDLEPILKRYL